MEKNSRNERDPNTRSGYSNWVERSSSQPNDLPDSDKDRDRLEPEESFIDLPDVKDIPGQEFVHVPPAGEMADTTISSDDEEGRGIFDRDETEDLRSGTDADVSRDEKVTLSRSDYMPTRDEDNLYRANLDNTDAEGEGLNERGFGEVRSARDLDVPGSELDDRDERAGAEDEENNDYSLGNLDNENDTGGRS